MENYVINQSKQLQELKTQTGFLNDSLSKLNTKVDSIATHTKMRGSSMTLGTMILSRMSITPLPFGNVLPVLHNTTPVLIRLATSTTPSLGTFNGSWLAQFGVGKS